MIKQTAKLRGIRPEMAIAHIEVMFVYHKLGFDCVFTEGTGGKHSRASLHYVGQAIDYRVKNVPRNRWEELARLIKESLNDEFDVVLETSVKDQEHIHVECQPKE